MHRGRNWTIILILSAFFSMFLVFSNLKNAQNLRNFRENSENSEKFQEVSEFLHHPFDNFCKFPLHSIYAPDVMLPDHSGTRLRTLKCNLTQGNDMATMDSHGYLYIHARYSQYPILNKTFECDIIFIEGGLRNETRKQGKRDIQEVEIVHNVVQNKRLWVNADAFLVRCYDRDMAKGNLTDVLIWEKPFAGLEDRKFPKYRIFTRPDLESFNNYGNPRHNSKFSAKKTINRYSIDILGFDSTSRTQFMRHLPRTTEIMQKLGYHFLYGYNKVADNSMVNLGPILIGDMPEALSKQKFDESGDINLDYIIPQNESMDPTNLKFLWKTMKESGSGGVLGERLWRNQSEIPKITKTIKKS